MRGELTMETAPAPVQRSEVVRILRRVRLRRDVGRAHDALPDVVDAVHEVRMIAVGEHAIVAAVPGRHQSRVNLPHHVLHEDCK